MKYIKIFSLSVIIFASGNMVNASTLPPAPTVPSAVNPVLSSTHKENKFSAFQTIYRVPALDSLLVPTVVEVSLPTHFPLSQMAVEESNTGTVIPYLYQEVRGAEPEKITVSADYGRVLYNLVDNNYNTTTDFKFTEEGQNKTIIILKSDKPVTSSQINLNLAKNVALPNYVRLTAGSSTSSQKIILATKRLNSTIITFPKTTATKWQLELIYSQPLRLAELHLVQDNVETHTKRTVRFLAQPKNGYKIYANPDRYVSFTTSESGDLKNNVGVVEIAGVVREQNTSYVIADSDKDGVPDVRDNCVSVANPEQTDVNNNDRGDLCDDFDRDGVLNYQDNCINKPNRTQLDEDGDGIGDVCDGEESRLTEKYFWIPWVGLGLAGLIIFGMFIVVLRRPNDDDEIAESDADHIDI